MPVVMMFHAVPSQPACLQGIDSPLSNLCMHILKTKADEHETLNMFALAHNKGPSATTIVDDQIGEVETGILPLYWRL